MISFGPFLPERIIKCRNKKEKMMEAEAGVIQGHKLKNTGSF